MATARWSAGCRPLFSTSWPVTAIPSRPLAVDRARERGNDGVPMNLASPVVSRPQKVLPLGLIPGQRNGFRNDNEAT
jgi:hypothetical protein